MVLKDNEMRRMSVVISVMISDDCFLLVRAIGRGCYGGWLLWWLVIMVVND